MSQAVQLALSIGDASVNFDMTDADGRDYVVQQARRLGLAYYEPPLPTVLMALAQQAKGAFVDVGANTGVYSLLVAATNPDIDVYAFEPIPIIRQTLEQNMGLNPTTCDRIEVVSCALSNANGPVTIRQHINPFGLIATSSTLETEAGGDIEYIELEIERCTLDDWAQSKGRIAFLKIDVEGHELAVLEGASTVIQKSRPFIAVEFLAGADFFYAEELLKTHAYADIVLRPGVAERVVQPRFFDDGWNHLLCPMEKVWDFAKICYRTGLPIR